MNSRRAVVLPLPSFRLNQCERLDFSPSWAGLRSGRDDSCARHCDSVHAYHRHKSRLVAVPSVGLTIVAQPGFSSVWLDAGGYRLACASQRLTTSHRARAHRNTSSLG